jgi:hypothetical protein
MPAVIFGIARVTGWSVVTLIVSPWWLICSGGPCSSEYRAWP